MWRLLNGGTEKLSAEASLKRLDERFAKVKVNFFELVIEQSNSIVQTHLQREKLLKEALSYERQKEHLTKTIV